MVDQVTGSGPAQSASPGSGTVPSGSPKSIVLFSDGTGNSSAKLFKTNVWRMYEAVDLGPPAAGNRYQIAYYDDGVGTSGFAPLAVLGGAFGFGLKRNVLDIYTFACRNFKEGDEIYGFGFSRGAFTMRLVIALIASQGLVRSDSEDELRRRSRDAYRAFRKDTKPRKLAWPTSMVRGIRDAWTRWHERKLPKYDQAQNYIPKIPFVGVWDTVAAYGGPIVEITRAVDNWIYALSMPNYHLRTEVLRARHALALDDERDAFQPLLWDEVHEEQLIAADKVKKDRLEQVWFTGMHSDVGGGYPDEALSYVSLLWMMEEAEKAKLRTLSTIKERFIALASSAGTLHDSRRGLGAYYRYQPRKIAAWLHPVDKTTFSLRDPELKKGLLPRNKVRVHESVIARIATGTDRYAPLALPELFEIVPPQAKGENALQQTSGSGTGNEIDDTAEPHPMIGDALRARFPRSRTAGSRARAAALEAVWDQVWRRRIAYFVTAGFTLLLLTMPMWADKVSWEVPVLNLLGRPIRLLSLFLPSFLDPWVKTYADNVTSFVLLALIIRGLMKYSESCERSLRDKARSIWRQAVTVDAPPLEKSERTPIEKFRNNTYYQQFIQALKWRILPDWVVFPLTVLLGVWLLGAAVTQIALPVIESRPILCASANSNLPELTTRRVAFSTDRTCVPTGVRVVSGKRYTVVFEITKEWRDSDTETTPRGLKASEMRGIWGYLGVPFRRVVGARFMEPLIEIRKAPGSLGLSSVRIYPLTLEEGDTSTVYRGSFEAKRDGELMLFVNDAVSLFDLEYFYKRSGYPRGNTGTACVTLQRSDLATVITKPESDSCPTSQPNRANVTLLRNEKSATSR